MKMTIYVPDDLAAEVKEYLGDANISAICQDALREQLDRVKAIAKIVKQDLERVEVYDGQRGRNVAFRGRKIAYGEVNDEEVYLTTKYAIAVYDGVHKRLHVFNNYADFAAGDWTASLHEDVADALGETYVGELDI